MSITRTFYTFLLLPIPITLAASAYRRWGPSSSKIKWDPKNVLQNFKNISQAKPEELYARVSPRQLLGLLPVVTQKMLGAENKKEAEQTVNTIKDVSGLCVGLAVATVPVIRFFSKCLEHANAAVCIKSSVDDLLSYSAIPLLAGAYLVSQVAKTFIINPLCGSLAKDPHQPMRLKLLSLEYEKMLTALNVVLEKPAEDPQFKETIVLVEQFLRISPHLINELHGSLSLDKDQATALILPLQTACRQFLIKHSYALKEAAEEARIAEEAKLAETTNQAKAAG
jgi:hypothetical protein